MTSEEKQFIEFNGKKFQVEPEVARQIADSVSKGGAFTSLKNAMSESSATTIARSSGETSKHNYMVMLRLTNLVVGDRRMGGYIWLQVKDRSTDEEELESLITEFPNALVTRSSR